MKINITSFFIFFFFGIACTNTKSNPFDNAATPTDSIEESSVVSMQESNEKPENFVKASMNQMLDALASLETNADFDADYANRMIILEQGAIELAKMELENGEDRELISLADKILITHSEDQATLKNILATIEDSETSDLNWDLQEKLSQMKYKMKNMNMSENMDDNFVAMMLARNEGAIALQTVEILKGNNTSLKDVASKGKINNENEIAELSDWLKSK